MDRLGRINDILARVEARLRAEYLRRAKDGEHPRSVRSDADAPVEKAPTGERDEGRWEQPEEREKVAAEALGRGERGEPSPGSETDSTWRVGIKNGRLDRSPLDD